jgi:YfiH family protein
MTFEDRGGLRLFRFESMPPDGAVHAILSRRGGVSPAPWSSLNLGSMVGDESDRVRENRRRALDVVGRSPLSVFDVWQVHSADVVVATAPRAEAPPMKADAILTDRPDVTLMMRFADCLPILLHDPVRQVVGIAHAGWLGTVRQVLRATIDDMQNHFGSRPEDISAGIGPSIAAHHYPVGPEVVDAFRDAFGPAAEAHLRAGPDGVHLDLWSANEELLRDMGVTHVETSGLCSACDTDLWFSHRAEGGRTGRFGALIALAP